MLHFSTDRLAGLDTMILKIAAAPGLGKERPRPPLAPVHNVLVCNATSPVASSLPWQTSPVQMLVHSPGAVPYPFRPLPPLPSPSPLPLPSFLDLSSESLSHPPPRRSAVSLPLFPASPPAPSPHRPKTKVREGPQWIPAFHHPNSPYVPWSSAVRQRILPPPSPLCPPSPHMRSGAVAPEPWASSTAHKPKRERLSWKSVKRSIRNGAKSVASRLESRMPCARRHMLSNYDDASPPAPRDSLTPFVSSDSMTLATWLAERRATASCVVDNTPKKMTVEEYERVGSWLDLRHSDDGWICGIQDCDMHTAGGSPHAAREFPILCLAMPFDSADLLSLSSRAPSRPFPAGPFSAPRRFRSLPRLPCQPFDLHPTQQARLDAGGCTARHRELGMPGGWSFN